MSNPREIRSKISSIRTTQKITNAMQQVAISKMQKARKKMEASFPYADKVLAVMEHVANSYGQENHPYLQVREQPQRVGYIVISTDRGLCGGLNINLFRSAISAAQQWQMRDIAVDWCLFGKKADVFFRQMNTKNIVAKTIQLGETPEISALLGGIKIMLDNYISGQVDRIFLVYNEFVSSIVQRPRIVQLVPFSVDKPATQKHRWDYIYEPEAVELLDVLLTRYIESQVYQAVVDNLACEQVARMIAMQNATQNATDLLDELQLLYNKARQTLITKELAEIIEGADC